MSKSLPANPDLAQLKKQAKDLLTALRANEPEALDRFTRNSPLSAKIDSPSPKLSDAQLILGTAHK
jgi:hypothetical protein